MEMTMDQMVIATMSTEKTSIAMERGLTRWGFFRTTLLKMVFLTSSLKLVSHFLRRILVKTQCQAFLKTFHQRAPMSFLKMLRKPTTTEMRQRMINAAMQTIYILYHLLLKVPHLEKVTSIGSELDGGTVGRAGDSECAAATGGTNDVAVS